MALELRVDGWEHGERVAEKFTCDGDDKSPAVSWSGVPPGAKSLVLWLVDPDAPGGLFVHWLLFNIPPHINAFPEWLNGLPEGTQEGTNGFGSLGYGGPCPPRGEEHRYAFEIFALDCRLKLSDGVAHRHVKAAMMGHVLAQVKIESVYSRESKGRGLFRRKEERRPSP